jgi:hypothetical protein
MTANLLSDPPPQEAQAAQVAQEPQEARNPPSISADELHKLLLEAHQLGNQIRHKFLALLLTLKRSQLYLKLGCSSIRQYAERYFHFRRGHTYVCISVAKALEKLPLIADAFDRGQIGWSALRQIARVASPKSQEEWLEFVRGKSVRRIEAEVSDARAKGRDRPRKDSYGLPGLNIPVTFNFTPEEHAIFEKAMAKISQEMGQSLGGSRVKPHEALLFLAKRVLETEPSKTALPGEAGRVEMKTSPFTILYHFCPGCAVAHLATPEGLVEVPAEVVERVEADARKVTIPPEEEAGPVPGEAALEGEVAEVPEDVRGEVKIDKPNTPALTRRALLRAGNTCENPMCGRTLGLHCHHIVFRSKGGPTSLQNTAAVCVWCHAVVHLGYLKVWKDRSGELHWEPRGDQLRRDFEAEAREISAIPVVQVRGIAAEEDGEESTRVDSARSGEKSPRVDSGGSEGKSPRVDFPGTDGKSTRVDSSAGESGKEKPQHDLKSPALRGIVSVLRTLGWSATDAKERVLATVESFESLGKEPSEEEILKKALSLRLS